MKLSRVDMIRFQANRGMSRHRLVQIYGPAAVTHALAEIGAVPMHFRVRFRMHREAQGLTIKQAAGRLNVLPGYITMVEDGKRIPVDPAIIQSIAEWMGEDAARLAQELGAL